MREHNAGRDGQFAGGFLPVVAPASLLPELKDAA
jgi:hypothetical protein